MYFGEKSVMELLELNMGSMEKNNNQGSSPSIGNGNMMTKSKTVVLWGSEDILITSVELLLASRKEWEVISLSNKECIDTLIRTVETERANIVIMQQGGHGDPTFLPLQLIKALPSLKVITFNLDNNSMEVFCKQKILVKEVSDLMSIFDNEP
jgi:hypothetical protein